MRRHIGHLTLRYVFDRSMELLYRKRNPNAPWLTQRGIEILQDLVKPSDRILEWGMGRSTVWFCQRAAHVTSFEHQPDFYASTRQALHAAGLTNHDLHLLPLEPGIHGGPPDYVRIPSSFEARSFDIALVDGRLRDICVRIALDLLRPSGVLVLDNAARYIAHRCRAPEGRATAAGPPSESWRALSAKLLEFRNVWTDNGVSTTAFFFLPE